MSDAIDWLSHLHTGFWWLWSIYMLVLSVWIVLQKREPVASLAWILALSALPIIGLLIYHVFGPQRIRRQRHRRLRMRHGPPLPDSGTQRDGLHELVRRATGYPLSQARDLRWLQDGQAMFTSLLADIHDARAQVHLLYYMLEPDVRGTQIRDALVAKAREGVAVRLLLDAVGSVHLTEAFLRPLREADVEVAWFHRLRFRLKGLWAPKLNFRNHRKLAVIDGRIAYTGGMNLCDQQDPSACAEAFHDLHLRLQGEVVRWLQHVFLSDWAYAGRALPADLIQNEDSGGIAVQVLTAGPDSHWETIHRAQVHAIARARTRAWLCTPYFVPSPEALMALTSAALRGMDVRVLLPRRCDNPLVTFAARSYFDELQRAGVRVFHYPRMLHAKALLVDDSRVLVGSANFDPRSFRLNFELGVLIEDQAAAGILAERLERDLHHASEVPSQRNLRWPAAVAEAVARLLSPLL